MNYNTNAIGQSFNSGETCVQTVKLLLAEGNYRAEFSVTVRGTITGMAVIESAVENLFENLFCDAEFTPRIELTDEAGNKLVVVDDDDQTWEWLGSMVISAEIVSVEIKKDGGQ